MNKIILSAISIMILSSPAMARDFSGFYAGLGATLDNAQGSGPLEGNGINGIGATGVVGYDMPLGGAFAGIEGNIDVNSADSTGLSAKWGWGIGGRIGTKVANGTGVYARAGYQRNKVSVLGVSSWGDGVRFGGGVETGISDKLSLRAEFNHVNYEQDIINNQGVIALVFGF